MLSRVTLPCILSESRLPKLDTCSLVVAAAALVEGMGGQATVVAGLEAQVPGSSSPDAMGNDSALHERMMFGEDVPSASPNPDLPPKARTSVTCPSANGDTGMCAESPSCAHRGCLSMDQK